MEQNDLLVQNFASDEAEFCTAVEAFRGAGRVEVWEPLPDAAQDARGQDGGSGWRATAQPGNSSSSSSNFSSQNSCAEGRACGSWASAVASTFWGERAFLNSARTASTATPSRCAVFCA